MCGIAGVFFAHPVRSVDQEVLRGMGQAIAHRGPDAEGFFREPGIGLVHRRLSIIDLAGGDQPIANENGSIQVVFNGEIYNYRELRAGLEKVGHRFQTNSDTEVLVHLYEDMGERLVEKLRGMFTFALWDRKERRLVLARDRLGIKPLYYYRDQEKIIFGSELKAILAFPGIQPRLNSESLEDYFTYGMVPGASSIFHGVEKLPPAHFLVLKADRLDARPTRYWRLRFEPDHRLGPAEWKEAIRAKVDEAVRLHLAADVPVGAFLSGGVDSSVVVGSAAARTGEVLQTFSMGFGEREFSELPFAREVADQYGTKHVEEIVSPDAVSLLDELTRFFDEPFADSSAIPTYLVSRLAGRSVKVVLSGDGGDEAFGGYARYAHDVKEAALRGWLPGWFRRGALGPLGRIWPKADWLPRPLRARTLLTNLGMEPGPAYANTLAICRQPFRRQLLSEGILNALNGHRSEQIIQQAFATAPKNDALAGMIAADVEVILPDDFLVKVDRASMAHGLEVRPPLLDHELLELSAKIPSKYKIHQGETKWIFKEAFASQLPRAVTKRPKQGFEMPIEGWLRGPLASMFEETVLSNNGKLSGLVNPTQARKLFQSHQRGLGRHGQILWSLLVLAKWMERYSPALPRHS